MGGERIDISRMVLTAGDRAAIRAIVPEMSDAFRTASWPLPVGAQGVIQVRRLDLGRIARGASRQLLARNLSDAARHVPLSICAPDRRVPADADALHWAGQAELLSAALIVQETSGDAPWWVHAALGGAQKGTVPPEQAVAFFLRKLPSAQWPAFVGAVLMYLSSQPKAHKIAVRVLQATSSLAPLPDSAAAAPIMRNPSEVSAPDTPDGLTPAQAVEGYRRRMRAALIATLPRARRKPVESLFTARSLPLDIQIAGLVFIATHLCGPASVSEIAARIARITREEGRVASAPKRSPDGPAELPARKKATAPDAPSRVARRHRADTPAPAQTTDTVSTEPPAEPEQALWPGHMTRLGGLPVLINLMQHAGLPAFDRALDQSVCLRVLQGFVARIASEDDALPAALPELASEPAIWPDILPVCLPSLTALRCVPSHLRVLRIKGQPDRRALSVYGDTAIVGILDARALRQVRSVMGAGRIRVGKPVLDTAGVAARLTLGLQILLQWMSFAIAGQGWRVLIQRPAWLAISATHLDVTCDLNTVRIAERRAGLDVSPGWVGWLSRVVNLHFERFDTPELPPDPSAEGAV